MVLELLNEPGKTPKKYFLKDIKEYERLDERFYDVDGIRINILGWNMDFLEFCPDDDPPQKDDILGWLWVIHPEWKDEILEYADEDLKSIIREYENDMP